MNKQPNKPCNLSPLEKHFSGDAQRFVYHVIIGGKEVIVVDGDQKPRQEFIASMQSRFGERFGGILEQ